MSGKRILVPAVTIADWGGVHEWVAECSRWLIDAGHHVTVVGGGQKFSGAVRSTGADLIEIANWSEWQLDFPAVLEDALARPYDLVFTHGPQARALGMKLADELRLPLFVMIHGAYHDYAFEWVDHAHRFVTASPSLFDFMTGIAMVPASMVHVVPNGLPHGVQALPERTLEEKLAAGVGRIVTASRLDHDKVKQIPVALDVIRACAEVRPDVVWQLDVHGDGRLRNQFMRALQAGVADIANARVDFHGWVPPDQIPLRMNEAVVGIVAGLGAMRSIATGALCVAVGARDNLGVQYGENLMAGIYSNFGDHGAQGYRATPIAADLRSLVGDSEHYDHVVRDVREQMVRLRSRDVVRAALFEALELDSGFPRSLGNASDT